MTTDRNLVTAFRAYATGEDKKKIAVCLHFGPMAVHRTLRGVVATINEKANQEPALIRVLQENYGSMMSFVINADNEKQVLDIMGNFALSVTGSIRAEDEVFDCPVEAIRALAHRIFKSVPA